jgi:hypothetical protein
MSEGQQSVTNGASNPVPAGFDALPVLDLSNPNFTREGNRLLAELRAKVLSAEKFGHRTEIFGVARKRNATP